MNKKIDISVLEENFKRRSNRFEQIINSKYYLKNCKSSIWEYFQIKGWYEMLINNNVHDSKQAFYNAAKIDIWYHKTYHSQVSDLFSYGRTLVLEASFLDDETLDVNKTKTQY